MKKRVMRVVAGVLAAGIGFAGFDISAEATRDVGLSEEGAWNGQAMNIHAMVTLDEYLRTYDMVGMDISAKKTAMLLSGELEELIEEKQFRNLVIAKVTNYVNVRSLPNEDGEIVGKLYNHSVGTFLGEENGWYQIQSGNVTGYVKADYCVTGEDAVELAKQVRIRMATVATQTLFVRQEPTTESRVIGMLPEAEELVVLEETDGWVKVDVEEGIGWISADYVTLHNEFVVAESREEEARRLAKEEAAAKAAREAAAKAAVKAAQSSASKGNTSSQNSTSGSNSQSSTASGSQASSSQSGRDVADYALQFVGNPYVYGGTSLTKGADCSGFVQSVYANFGVSLPRTSSEQRSAGYAVDGISNAQAGDLVCYSGHIGIYIGDGKIVHASSAKTGIITSKADYRKILAVRRIF